jgi:protein arginine kinase
MIIDDLVTKPGSWLALDHDTGIIISSRVRLARNLRDVAFPGWAGEQECTNVCRRIQAVFGSLNSMKDPMIFDMNLLTEVDREILKERHLISLELAEKGAGSSSLSW